MLMSRFFFLDYNQNKANEFKMHWYWYTFILAYTYRRNSYHRMRLSTVKILIFNKFLFSWRFHYFTSSLSLFRIIFRVACVSTFPIFITISRWWTSHPMFVIFSAFRCVTPFTRTLFSTPRPTVAFVTTELCGSWWYDDSSQNR